jgi:hypothetical protein
MNDEELRAKLAALLHQTSEDHHVAYKATDGVDADWSIWYAGHLLENGFDKLLGATILKSDLIYLLVSADKEIQARAPGGRWERYYADFFIERYVH